MKKGFMAIVLASLFVLAVTSCTWPNNAEVLITGGYITGSGNEAVLECELYNLDVPTDFIDESCTPTLAVALSSVDGYAVISGEGSRIILDGSVSTADGPTLTCTIDITAQLEDRFWGPGGEYGSIRYIYHFSKEQTPTIPIYNQFYLDPPPFRGHQAHRSTGADAG